MRTYHLVISNPGMEVERLLIELIGLLGEGDVAKEIEGDNGFLNRRQFDALVGVGFGKHAAGHAFNNAWTAARRGQISCEFRCPLGNDCGIYSCKACGPHGLSHEGLKKLDLARFSNVYGVGPASVNVLAQMQKKLQMVD